MTIYLSGHGGWDVKNSAVPYARIPRGVTMHFYTENGKNLATAAMAMIAIERGDAAGLPGANDLLGDPNGVYEEYKTCPNYTLHKDTPEKNKVIEAVIGAGNVIFVQDSTPLCTGIGKEKDRTGKPKRCIDSDSPIHTCGGLLANPRLVGQEVVWLACRSLGLDAVGGRAVGVNALQEELGAGQGTQWAEFTDSAWTYFDAATPDDFWAWFQQQDARAQIALLAGDPIRARLISEGRDLRGVWPDAPDPSQVAPAVDTPAPVVNPPAPEPASSAPAATSLDDLDIEAVLEAALKDLSPQHAVSAMATLRAVLTGEATDEAMRYWAGRGLPIDAMAAEAQRMGPEELQQGIAALDATILELQQLVAEYEQREAEDEADDRSDIDDDDSDDDDSDDDDEADEDEDQDAFDCTEICPTCGEECAFNEEHTDEHECMDDHAWVTAGT